MRDNDKKDLLRRCHLRVRRARATWFLHFGLFVVVVVLAISAEFWKDVATTVLTILGLAWLVMLASATAVERADAKELGRELQADLTAGPTVP